MNGAKALLGRNLYSIPLSFILIGVMIFSTGVIAENSAELTLGGVDQDSGNTSTLFTFYVTFSDPDGIPPNSILLIIAESSVVLSPLGDDHASGVIYQVKITLPEGDHEFYFIGHTSDGNIRYPADRNLEVKVKEIHSPKLSMGDVSPRVGNSNDEFKFSILYMDPENREPEMMILRIGSTIFHMTPDGTDQWGTGVNFTLTMELPPGNHSYFFYTRVEDGSAKFPEEPGTFLNVLVEEIIPYTVIDETYVLSEKGPDVFSLSIEGEHIKETAVFIYLDGNKIEMGRTYIDEGGVQSFDMTIHLSEGSHHYHYFVSWIDGELRYPETGDLEILKIIDNTDDTPNIPPIPIVKIRSDGMNVNFNASASLDPDGSIPLFFWVFDNVYYTEPVVDHEFQKNGYYPGSLTITDNDHATRTKEFDIWVHDITVDQPSNRLSSFHTIDQSLHIEQERGDGGIDIENGPEKDRGLNFIIDKDLNLSEIIVIDITSSNIPCWDNEEPIILVDEGPLPVVDLATILSTNGDSEMVSIIENQDSYQIVLYLEKNGTRDLTLCSLMNEKGEGKDNMATISLISIASTFIFILSILSIGTFLIFRYRTIGGPKDPHEDFAISSGDSKNGSSIAVRKGKKIEWEAYLEE